MKHVHPDAVLLDQRESLRLQRMAERGLAQFFRRRRHPAVPANVTPTLEAWQ